MRDTHPNDHEHATHAPAHAAHERATHDRHAGHSVAMFREQFWITVLLTVPTLTRSTMIQQWFRFNAPVFPGSAYLPAIFGTAVYL